MKSLLFLFLIITISGACQKMKTGSSNIPRCIQTYIDSIKNNPGRQVGIVEEYEFQGKLVYAFGPSKNLRDGSTLIKTSDCKDLCNVGGFAGLKNNQCNGDNFFEKSVLKRKIWTEEK